MSTIIHAGTAHCSLCQRVKELRPYGPNGTWVCFSCGMEDRKGTEERFKEILDGGAILDLTDQKGMPE